MTCFALALFLAGCDGSGGSGGSGNDVDPGPTVRLSGRITYAFVPAVAPSTDRNAPEAYLDYDNTEIRPARGVQVAVVAADDGRELAAGTTDGQGRYALDVPKNTPIRVRALARLLQPPGQGASWDFSIRDNTSPGYRDLAAQASLYAMEGDTFDSGTAALSRNLHADSGWTGAGYGAPRSAAPFAILDQFYSAIQKILASDAQAVFAPMVAYWSIHNRPATGDKAAGEISTSHWQSRTDRPGLYILGLADEDTDEYDTSVVVHEWGHYFESNLSRSDSIGGGHGSGDALDMRVAFGEAWGNALAGMVRDDPIYVDTMGVHQAEPGVIMDLDEIPANEPRGWFNEASVQHLLYRLYQAPGIGFGPIYQVMAGPQKTTDAFTSLFSFATYLRAASDAAAQGVLDTLLTEINTVAGTGLDIWGTHQDYPASLPGGYEDFVVPVYRDLPLGPAGLTVCGTDRAGDTGNKLGNEQFLRVRIKQSGDYRLALAPSPKSGPGDTADVTLFSQGQLEGGLEEIGHDDGPLEAGIYTLSVANQPLTGCVVVSLDKL